MPQGKRKEWVGGLTTKERIARLQWLAEQAARGKQRPVTPPRPLPPAAVSLQQVLEDDIKRQVDEGMFGGSGQISPVPPGNIDLAMQPTVPNPQGGTSTVYSRSFNIDGEEVLLPSVTADGRLLQSDEEVIREYQQTGRHLGRFRTPQDATEYASRLHREYEQGMYQRK